MQFSKEWIEKYKRIYKEEFGEEITDQEAYNQGLRLVNLLRVVMKKELGEGDVNQPDNQSDSLGSPQ
jgi:aldehyde:ferredoxin oxidoreductase